jgi:hypothetical protein
MNNSPYQVHNHISSLLTKGMIMKRISILSVGVATVGMTCLLGYASAANSASGDLISDSMLMAQSTPAPGGRGGGAIGEPGRADKGTTNEMKVERGNNRLTKPGMGTDGTSPAKAKPGTDKDTGRGANTGSDSGRTGTSSGSPGSGSGPSSGAGSGAK